MHSTEYLRLLKSMPGVVRVELAPADLIQSVAEMEASINRMSGGMKLENIGLFQCLHHQMVAVAFCDSDFKRPEEITMRMIDFNGVVVGHDVPPSRLDEFKARDDVVWLGQNFVMYLDRIGDANAKMVMGSSTLVVDGADGTDCQMFFPSCSSADMINSRFSVDDRKLSTAVIGVDGVEVDVENEFRTLEMSAVQRMAGGSVEKDD